MISTREEFAQAIGVKLQTLTYVLYREGIDSYYNSFTVPKRNGGVREIDAPTGALKYIQKRISFYLWNVQLKSWQRKGISPNISHAFQRKKSIITNANVHKNKRYVVNFDLEDYFSSIHFGRVKGFFEKNYDFMVSPEIATVIAQLTCYQGRLPQGAPSSPIITNLIGNIMDARLLKLAKKYKMDYTRYADDLTFSSNAKDILKHEESFKLELEYIVKESGFRINHNKTRVMYKDSRQSVTGLVVNKKISIKREYYKQTRAMAYTLYKTGEFTIDGGVGSINVLEGRFAFINQVERWNNSILAKKKDVLTCKEKQYKLFLIYKYFFRPIVPTILVEGKTDVLYIKSALRALSNQYKNLISYDDNHYSYNISFLNKTSRLKYFFNLNDGGGGESFKNIVSFYKDADKTVDIEKTPIEWLKSISNVRSNVPVIMLLDNESKDGSPLQLVISSICNGLCKSYKKKDIAKINDDLNLRGYKRVKDNLYIVTMPKENPSDIEIEDLFKIREMTRIEVDGRILIEKFEKNSDYDKELHLSKHAFSKYVYHNYRSIDFNGFIPLIDAINAAIEDCNNNT